MLWGLQIFYSCSHFATILDKRKRNEKTLQNVIFAQTMSLPKLYLPSTMNAWLKPSISTHSKTRTKACTRHFICLVLNTLCSKAKHVRHLVWDLIRGFEWLEILGFILWYSTSPFLCLVHGMYDFGVCSVVKFLSYTKCIMVYHFLFLSWFDVI